jgi:membrane protein
MNLVRQSWEVIREVWQGYWRDECIILSAAISFYAIFSVIPFLCLVLVIWGFILKSTDVLFTQIVQFATAFVPEISQEVLNDIRSVVAHRGALGWVGIIFLFWIFDVVFYSIAHAFDRIFDRGGRRKYYKIKLFSFASLLIVGLVLYLSMFVAFFAALVRDTEVSIGGIPISNLLANSLSFKYIAFLLTLLLFTTTLRIVPHSTVRMRYAIWGGVLCTTLWYLSKIAFHWYIENIAVFNIVYGTLGTLIIMVVWIFYSFNILLISAEFVSVVQKRWDRANS